MKTLVSITANMTGILFAKSYKVLKFSDVYGLSICSHHLRLVGFLCKMKHCKEHLMEC